MKFLIKLMTLAVFLLSLQACALSSGQINGQVLEERTGQPIPDAIVVVTWKGDWWAVVESSTVCYHVETARTDAQGKYHIPAWSSPWKVENLIVFNREVYADAYKPGYTWPINLGNTPKNIFLARFKGTPAHRLESFARDGGYGCGFTDGSAKNMAIFFRARYEEAKNLAVTKEELDLVDGLLTGAESLELGSQVADQRREQRRLDKLKENK